MGKKDFNNAEVIFLRSYLNKPNPRDDEHLLSFLLRVAEANEGYGSAKTDFFANLGYAIERGGFHPEQLNIPINGFFLLLLMRKTPLEFYMESTEIQFVNLIEKEELLDLFWIKHYQPVHKSRSLYRNKYVFNMCEICMHEERKSGLGPIIHLSHQLPHVKVCHKHNKKLIKCVLKEGWDKPFRFERYDEEDNIKVCDTDYKFAKFMYELSKQKINYSLRDIVFDINQKLESKPASYFLRESSDDRWVCLYNKYAAAGGFQLDDCVEDMYHLMCFIYADPQNIDIIPKYKHYAEFMKAIEGEYELLGGYRESVVELRCLECHETFITTPRLILYHHECPFCKAISHEYYRNLAEEFCKKEYRERYQLECYDHDQRKIVVFDNKKKKKIEFNALRFITNAIDSRQDTTQKTHSVPVWDRYSDYGTFEQYYKGEFIINEIARGYFLMIMFDLVGDEYQLVGNFVNMFTEVELLHVLCGKIIFIKPFDFINGKRCANCKVRHTGEEIEEYLNNVVIKFRFVSSYDHTMGTYLFRAMKLNYSNKIACVDEIYQFTEDILIQELLKQKHYDSIFEHIYVNRADLYNFFYQKDISCLSREDEDSYEYTEMD